jgi:hypothetical protein
MNDLRHSQPLAGIVALLLLTTVSAAAQEISETDVQGWLQYEYQNQIGKKLRGSFALGYRELLSTEDEFGGWSRLHLRANFSYGHRRWVTFEGGLGGFHTFSNNFSDLFELRTWQGAIFFWPATRLWGREVDLRHRFRLEQRWTNLRDSGESDFGLRIRYRLATFMPLNRPTIEVRSWYLPLMCEFFGDLGGEAPDYFAERIRLSIGVGRVFSDKWRLEFRYTAQKSRDTVESRFETTDHILDLRLRTAVPLRNLFPGRSSGQEAKD